MTIQEAIKSGKRVKRKYKFFSDDFGEIIDSGSGPSIVFQYGDTKDSNMPLSVADILADDWEVEVEKIQITEKQVREALSAVKFEASNGFDIDSIRYKKFLKRLGFKS